MSKGKLTQNGVHLREHEYLTVQLLLDKGYDIELIPPSQIKNLPMPDIMMQGVPWEIKSPNGNGKNTLKHIIQKAKHQSESIIIDLRRCKIDDEQAVAEITKHYRLSKRIRRMKIVKKSGDIIDFSK